MFWRKKTKELQRKRLPVGISDFKEIIERNFYFVDKSLLIKEILDNGPKVLLLPRPRRFGKTLNLSMIKYFFEKHPEAEDHKHLFKDLQISNHPEIMNLQGKSPIIFLTFKDIKTPDWRQCFYGLRFQISQAYERHSYLLNSNTLSEHEKDDFLSIINKKENLELFSNSLANLSRLIFKYHKQKVLLLIDEYDTPIHAGYIYDYYDQIVAFMRTFLSGGLKDNTDLHFSVITGIMRVAKESIFSGLNNLAVRTIIDKQYSDKFGFTKQETEELVNFYTKSKDNTNNISMDEVQKWYNGYNFYETEIYNPWSILNFLSNESYAPYWVNTSSNDLIKQLVRSGNKYFRSDLHKLIEDIEIEKAINDNIVFPEIKKNYDTLWSFLLFSGYLTYSEKKLVSRYTFCKLKIPNEEVKYVFEEIILKWIEEGIDIGYYQEMLQSLTKGDIQEFESIFINSIINNISFFDPKGDQPELFYHALVLGMLISLNNTHQIKSNRESGYGRYDIMIIPRDKTDQPGIIIEFKKFDKTREKTIEDTLARALKQIEEKKYETELLDMGIKRIVKLAIVFKGKDALIKEI